MTFVSSQDAAVERFRTQLHPTVGSSALDSAAAERLQFTVGEGPCLHAVIATEALRVDEDDIRGRWPAFYDALAEQTSFRSIIALPVTLVSGVAGAIDMYFEASTMPSYQSLTDTQAIANEMGGLLGQSDPWDSLSGHWSGGELPDWAYGKQSRQRLRVWVAVGVVMESLDLDVSSALALLRARAYATNDDLDELSSAVIEGTLSPRSFEEG